MLSYGNNLRRWSHGDSHPDLRNAIALSYSWTIAPERSARPGCRSGGYASSAPRFSVALSRYALHRVRAGLQSAASTSSASRAFWFCDGVTAGTCTRIFWFTARNSELLSYGHSCFLSMENGAPARTRTSNLRLRRAACRTLTPREL